MMKRTQIFISYSHIDTEYLERLKVHFRPFERDSVEVWSDTKIQAGQLWQQEIKKALEKAAVAILLISADFLASDFIANDELPPLLEAAEKEGVKILPVILKPCLYNQVKSLSQFQAVNTPDSPLISLDEADREKLWTKIALIAKQSLDEFKVKESTHKVNEIKKYQIINLQRIFNTASFSPCFHKNPKYPTDGVPRIAYDDVMSYRYIIRSDDNFDGNHFWSDKKAKIVAKYNTIEELIDDGWILD